MYLTRTIPNVSHHLRLLDLVLHSVFIPILTGRPPSSDIDLNLFALRVRLGGLGITLPSLHADHDFDASLMVTSPLKDLIYSQDQAYSFAALDDQMSARADIRWERRLQATSEADRLRDELSPSLHPFSMAGLPPEPGLLVNVRLIFLLNMCCHAQREDSFQNA